jgi:hypothetical protein
MTIVLRDVGADKTPRGSFVRLTWENVAGGP